MIGSSRSLLSLTAAIFITVGVVIAAQVVSLAGNAVEHVVEIRDFKFVPDSIVVKTGDTVTWINKDIVPHTATDENLLFDTGELKQNESASVTIVNDQKIDYFCKFHPMMKAVLLLE